MEKPALQNFATYFQKPYCDLCDTDSRKLSSCGKCSFFEEKRRQCKKLNLCNKCSGKKDKDKGCQEIKNELRYAWLRCNSKCYISARCDKDKNTSLYINLGINTNNDETYILPLLQIPFSSEARKMAIICILDTGSQRSYFLNNITKQAKQNPNEEGKITFVYIHEPFHLEI